jgi:hypothetical protein
MSHPVNTRKCCQPRRQTLEIRASGVWEPAEKIQNTGLEAATSDRQVDLAVPTFARKIFKPHKNKHFMVAGWIVIERCQIPLKNSEMKHFSVRGTEKLLTLPGCVG